MSKRESISAALVRALSGTSGVGTNIFRSRLDAISADESPALVVLFESEEVAEITNGDIDVRLVFVLEVHARASAVPEKSADAACVSAHGKLMAAPTLGGLLVDLAEIGTEWDHDESDQSMVIVRMRFAAWYRRPRNSLG